MMKPSKSVKLFLFLIRLSPYLRSALIRWIYNKYATKNTSEKNAFLNYGYHDDDNPLVLNAQDEPNRFFIQLYHRAAQNIGLDGKDLVEIGCGQGAGGVYLCQYYSPRSYIGIDLSEKAIAFCQQHNRLTNMQWMQGCADKLPLLDESADVVINIESSHFYPSMEGFVAEVQRILRPKGYMVFADFRCNAKIEALDKCFSDAGLGILERSDITPQVLNSLARISDRRKAHINATYPAIWRPAAREMSGVKGSPIYNSFINGEQKYLCYLLQKL